MIKSTMGNELTTQILMPPDPPKYDDKFEELFWINDTIPAKYHNYETRKSKKAHFTVLYSGNINDDIGERNSFFKIVRETMQVNLLCIDYPTFGMHVAKEELTEALFFECLYKAYKWLISVKNIPPKNIVLMGKGMGVGPLIFLAYKLWGGQKTLRGQKNDDLGFNNVGFAGLFLISPIGSTNSLLTKINGTKHKLNYFSSTRDICRKIKSPTIICNLEEDAFAKDARILKGRLHNVHRHVVISDSNYPDEDDQFLDTCIDLLDELAPIRKKTNLDLFRRPSIFVNPDVVLKQWLSGIGLEMYFQHIMTCGFYNVEILSTVTRDELMNMGITRKIDQDNFLSKASSGHALVEPDLIDFLIDGESIVDDIALESYLGIYCTLCKFNEKSVIIAHYDRRYIDPDHFKKLSKELCTIDSPYIVKPLGVIMDLEELSIVWPWNDQSLSDFIQSGQSLNIPQKIRYIEDILLAVQYFHTDLNYVLGSNLKTHNIYINKSMAQIGPTITLLSQDFEQQFHPPEVRDNMYTKSGDIYLLGLILREIAYSKSSDSDQNQKLKILINPLIQRCFDSAMTERPTISEIIGTVKDFSGSLSSRKFTTKRKSFKRKNFISGGVKL